MIKSFYKSKCLKKNFFRKGVKVRSTAYGSDVAQDFKKWRDYFYEKWNNCEESFLLSAQGSINGNPVRAGRSGGEVKNFNGVCTTNKSTSVLSPLWINDLLLEIDKEGFVSVNGNKETFNAGVDQKAWAIMSINGNYGIENFLLTIAKKIGSSELSLTVYRINSHGIEKQEIAALRLENTNEISSRLVCLGRNIFIVHNSKLDYFYFNSENKLENVSIGGDDVNKSFEWCKYIRSDVVADDAGRVFWISDNDVYGFTIGFPRQLSQIKNSDSEQIFRIQCVGESLLVYATDKRKNVICRIYDNSACGAPRVFTVGSLFNIVISKTHTAFKFIKLVRERNLKAQVVTYTGTGEKVSNEFAVNSVDNLFYADGYLIDNAVYVKTDRNKNCVKIQRETVI